jgi:CRP-like cAMP-binding protein
VLVEAKKTLSSHPLFSHLSSETLSELANSMQEILFPKDSIIVKEDDPVDSILFITKGNALVSTIDKETSNIVLISKLYPSEVIGLSQTGYYSSTGFRTATVTAETDISLYQLNIETLLKFQETHPEALKLKQDTTQLFARISFIKKINPFKALSTTQIRKLVDNIQILDVKADSIIFNENDESDKCFFIQSGEVAISTEDAGDQIVATLKENDLFGETGIILGTKRNATAKTLTDCKLFCLDKSTFIEVTQSERVNKINMMQFIRSRSQVFHNNLVTVHQSSNRVGENIYLLKHLTSKEILELSEEAFFIWRSIDGKRTLENITRLTMSQFSEISSKDVFRAFIELAEMDFIKIKGYIGTEQELEEEKPWLIRTLSKLPHMMEMFYDFKNVDGFITRTYPYVKWLFSPLFQTLMLLTTIIGFACFLKLIPYALPQLSLLSKPHFTAIYIAFFTTLFLHEFSHAYTTKHFGREVRAMGIGWFWLFPAAYCDTSDILLAPKKERLIVNVIGLYLQAFISGAVSIIGIFIHDPILSSLCWLFAIINYFSIIYNFDPAIDLDGYYVFQDLTEDLDIRENTVKWAIQQRFADIKLHLKEFIFSFWLFIYHFSIIPLIWWVQITVLSPFIPVFSHSVLKFLIPLIILTLSLTSVWSLIKLKE